MIRREHVCRGWACVGRSDNVDWPWSFSLGRQIWVPIEESLSQDPVKHSSPTILVPKTICPGPNYPCHPISLATPHVLSHSPWPLPSISLIIYYYCPLTWDTCPQPLPLQVIFQLGVIQTLPTLGNQGETEWPLIRQSDSDFIKKIWFELLLDEYMRFF